MERLSMKTRKELTQKVCQHYRMAGKKEKTVILTEFVHATGYDRSYAATLLRSYGKTVSTVRDNKTYKYCSTKQKAKRGGRPVVYTRPVRDAVIRLWELFGYRCGKLLAPIIKSSISHLSDYDESILSALKTISAATLDRILAVERSCLNIKGNSYTRSQAALIDQIPIRTFGDWKGVPPGHFQMDCVGHDGGIVSEQCCFTLSVTDVYSGWIERKAMLNRASKWVIEAMTQIRKECPVPIVEIHPDNGSEFINHQMVNYCKDNHLKITRSRPGKKNDNCYVEQKNFDAVRKLVGYARYTTPETLRIMNELYHKQGLLQNYVYPCFKLEKKVRRGSRYSKTYSPPITPAQRLLECPDASMTVKEQLHSTMAGINPLKLAVEVKELQNKLQKEAIKLRSSYPQKRGA